MKEAVILLIYHQKDEITLNHFNRFKEFNSDVPIEMIRHEDFPLDLSWDYNDMWGSSDNIFYRWFLSERKILADRYFIFDYDTYCNDSIKNFYSKVWDCQFACSDHFSIQQYFNWSWFEKYKEQLKIYQNMLYGVCPMSGIMIRYTDTERLISEQQNNTIWRNVFSELRVGSVLNLLGVKFSFIDEQRKSYITPFTHVVPQSYISLPGIFHPVKDTLNISNGDITFLSAAYPCGNTFDKLTFSLRVSNDRYNNYKINFYGKDRPQDYKSLYNAKIINLLDILKNKCTSNLVCYLDSADIILNKNLDENFINIFKSFNCSLLFGGETCCYPFSQLEFLESDEYEFKYLNSGMFIGYRNFIIDVLQECISYYDRFPKLKTIGWGPPNDQTFFWTNYLIHKLQNRNDIQIDYEQKLFLNVNGKDIIKDFDYSKGYLTYKNTRPYVLHTPGNYKVEANRQMLELLNLKEKKFLNKYFEPDGHDYYILYEASVEASKLIVEGLACEIGIRKGGGAEAIIQGFLDNNRKVNYIGIDPYGNIPYTVSENNIVKYDYTNQMYLLCMKNLYEWCHQNDYPIQHFKMTDERFFNLFQNGIWIYDNEEKLINNYILVYFDGPHCFNIINKEVDFFITRTPVGGVWVFDNINGYYDHSKIVQRMLDFQLISKSHHKASYKRIK